MKVKKSVTHQGIGGKEFKIDKTVTLTNSDVIHKGIFGGNWACRNFLDRRPDFTINFPYKLYYGHVNGLGYVVSEDELEP